MAKNYSDIYNVIGKNIRKFRMQKGLKQHELAEQLFLSESFVAKLDGEVVTENAVVELKSENTYYLQGEVH